MIFDLSNLKRKIAVRIVSAEREGFEPSGPFRDHTLSRRARSAALSPLQFLRRESNPQPFLAPAPSCCEHSWVAGLEPTVTGALLLPFGHVALRHSKSYRNRARTCICLVFCGIHSPVAGISKWPLKGCVFQFRHSVVAEAGLEPATFLSMVCSARALHQVFGFQR